MFLTIVADDLTGACDTGALFTGLGRVGVFVAPAGLDGEWETVAVDTETRALCAEAARTCIRETARQVAPRLGAGRLFKKIDSTLRGHVGAELDILMQVGSIETAVVCPAFPEQGRRVVDGVLTVDGRPAHETAIGQDPGYPGCTSRVTELLAAGAGRPVVHLPLSEVRASGAGLVRVFGSAPGGMIAADAETPEDLDVLARAALQHHRLLLAGSAGLARAVSAVFRARPRGIYLPGGRAWLVVSGSLHPAARAQTEVLAGAGVVQIHVEAATGEATVAAAAAAIEAGHPAMVTTLPPTDLVTSDARLAVAEALGRAAAGIIARRRPDLIVVVGGDTLHALFRALGAARIELTGAPASGLALGDLVVADGTALPLLTKAGGFGASDLWLRLMRQAA
jgi:D-threonate/D-erythronate kinase